MEEFEESSTFATVVKLCASVELSPTRTTPDALYLHDKLCALGGFGLNPEVTGPDLFFFFREFIIPRSVVAFSGLDDLESGPPFFCRRSSTSNSLSLVPTIITVINAMKLSNRRKKREGHSMVKKENKGRKVACLAGGRPRSCFLFDMRHAH